MFYCESVFLIDFECSYHEKLFFTKLADDWWNKVEWLKNRALQDGFTSIASI